MRSAPSVDVAVGIVRAGDGRLLLAERTARQVAPGFWELPGGKIDPGETAEQAVARELDEEIGIVARSLRAYTTYEHAYKTKRVNLHFFYVDEWTGNPHGREGQRLAWVDPAAPGVAPLLPSNERVLTALGLPARYLLTPGCDPRCAERFLAALPETLEATGARLVGVSEPHLPPDQRVAFARRVAAMAETYGARTVVEGTALDARRAGVAALQSASLDLRRLPARPQVSFWVAACRNAKDVESATVLGADALLLTTDEEAPARAASAAAMPFYLETGSAPDARARARRMGAVGVATRWADPAATTRTTLL